MTIALLYVGLDLPSGDAAVVVDMSIDAKSSSSSGLIFSVAVC
jgi:hypothetical protein